MRHLIPALCSSLTVLACSSSHSAPDDGGSGLDGGCPIDFIDADGMPCADEGRFCGRCTDPCSFCNLLECSGGRWHRLEAHPPPGPCVSFACGPEIRCDAVLQFCVRTEGDAPGASPSFRCERYPDACQHCDCLDGDACEGDAETGIRVTRRGG